MKSSRRSALASIAGRKEKEFLVELQKVKLKFLFREDYNIVLLRGNIGVSSCGVRIPQRALKTFWRLEI